MIPLSLNLISCGVNRENLFGKYEWKGIFEVDSELIINPDKTFRYDWHTGLINGTTHGKWKLVGRDLILNSDKQPQESSSIEMIPRDRTVDNRYEISVIDKEGKHELISVSCMLFKDTILIRGRNTDIHGNCYLTFDEVSDRIRFEYLGYRAVEILKEDLISNSFVLQMKEEDKHYRFFTEEVWEIKGKGLEERVEIPNTKFESRSYRKVRE